MRTNLQVKVAVWCTNEYKWQCINIYIQMAVCLYTYIVWEHIGEHKPQVRVAVSCTNEYKWQCVYTYIVWGHIGEHKPQVRLATKCPHCVYKLCMMSTNDCVWRAKCSHATTNLLPCTPQTSVHAGANVCLHSSYSSSNCIVTECAVTLENFSLTTGSTNCTSIHQLCTQSTKAYVAETSYNQLLLSD